MELLPSSPSSGTDAEVAGRKAHRIFCSWIAFLSSFSTMPQISVRLVVSLSGVMMVDCTRNLSRHLADDGGSSFMGCKRTWTSIFSPGSMRPELGRTQYCFGAVVLTLKATGWLLGLDTCSERLTSCVSGRGKPNWTWGLRLWVVREGMYRQWGVLVSPGGKHESRNDVARRGAKKPCQSNGAECRGMITLASLRS